MYNKSRKSPLVMVIDDEYQFTTALSAHLSLDGYESVICNDGDEAFELINEHLPDIIVLDLMLPSVNGIALARHVNDFYSGIQIISVSGHYNDQTIDAMKKSGVKHFLEKPFVFDEITKIINKSLADYKPVSLTKMYDVESETLLKMVREINAGVSFEDNIQSVYENARKIINFERLGIALFNKATGDIVQRHVISERPVLLENGYSAKLKNTTLEVTYLTKEPRILNDLEEYNKVKPESESTEKMVEEGMRSSATLPLIVDDECLGFAFFTSTRKNNFTDIDRDFLEHASSHIAMALSKSLMLEDMIIGMVQGIAEMGERRDMETGKHMKRLAEYCKIMGEKMLENGYPGLTQELLEDIYLTVPLHDVGKVMVTDVILRKPSKLDNEEYETIKCHVQYGAEILESIKENLQRPELLFMDTAIDIAKYHHEWYDGRGYSEGLKGDEIPLSAQITALADVFDALISKRCYKESMSLDEVMEEILSQAGTHFSEDLVDIFVEVKDEMVSVWQEMSD